jgi:LPS sulfotransferase NodH
VHALCYEEIAADVAGAVRAVCEHLGVALPEGAVPEAPLRRQADELSEAWVERYESDARAVPVP